MGSGWLLQIFVDLLLGVGLFVLWRLLNRPAAEDPRLSRGLQLLQSKLAVLEDLSDRADAQVRQLTALLDQKTRQLQNKIIEAEHQIHRVEAAMKKSKEVAEIFQDRIPHQEIIERQNTVKYVKAAQLAHAGKAVEEIAAEVGLPISQVELIAKVNQSQLRFDESQLPEWARPKPLVEKGGEDAPTQAQAVEPVATGGFEALTLTDAGRSETYDSLRKLGEDFRQALRTTQEAVKPTATSTEGTGAASVKVIRKEVSRVQFPRSKFSAIFLEATDETFIAGADS